MSTGNAMRGCKDIFTILLVIQVCSVAWALFYGHPDAESIDVGRHSTQPLRDRFIIDAAIRRGMDGEAVAQLLRTKEPVVKVKVEPNGVTKTTTYSLDPDGGISSKTVSETRSVKHYESGTLPDSVSLDDILKSPSGTVTRTFTDKDGAKVTQTFGVSKPKTTSIFDSDDNDDLIRSHTFTSSGGPTNIHHTPFRPWPSQPEEGIPSNFHKTTKTFTGPNGEKRVVETWSSEPNVTPEEHKFPSTKWPSFDFSPSWQLTDTMGDPGEWTVVEGNPNVEATTNHNFHSWTPKSWLFPNYPTLETTTTTTTTAKPHRMPMQPKATTPLPSLDDFLRSQYGHTTPPTRTATTTASPVSFVTTTKPPVTIKVEDLPITHILHNGQPADESIIRRLPAHMVPKTNTENVLKIENIRPIEAEAVPQNVETNVRKITKTLVGPSKPALKDLDPQMQEILRNAGISPDDITNIDGDTITKTRKEPDGRVITTTYKVRTSPAVTTTYEEVKPTIQVFSSTPHQHKPLDFPIVPHHTPYKPSQISPISEFLAKLGLTKSDIFAKNGEYTRTIIDDDGQVLTATFILSNPINRTKASTHDSPPKMKPLK